MDNKILEIKALKRAWEEMEPGRAIRAELSRARYLEEYGLMNKLDNKTIVDDSGSTITIKSDGFVLLGTCQQGVPVILSRLMLPGRFDLVTPSFIVRDVTTELSGPRPISCMTEMYLQLIDNLIQMIKDHSSFDHTSLLDPSKIYILKFPPELNRTLYPIQLMNLNKFYHHFNEIE
ncbi:unnamed protein product, partial [Schistosoma curassoni]|uniref:Profilin n=1 Tax=Schistosoma curassoni TaxID=6186 RepID=A0A183JSC5_9TREM